jgi:FtsP/CotA-like multicopper oxidase with cupredoxin domain
MKTRKRYFLTTGALLLLIVAAVGFSTFAAAAPGAAPSAQIPVDPMPPLLDATCNLVDTTRTCDLWALPGSLTMPDGVSLPVWGFAVSAAGPASVPGPVIRANVGETLEVVLHNEIVGQDISLAFPGQEGLVPDMTGVPAGGMATYTLDALTPGTFLYEAGLTSGGARQVAMGLVGPLIVDDPAAIPTWTQEVVLVFSEIDPAFNINPANYSMNRFRAKYWLINGLAHPDTGWIDVAAGSTILMRYLNAGVEDHTLGMLGLDQSVIATDGEALPFPQGAIAPAIAPGQTLEALVVVPAVDNDTLFPLYNASLHQHNNNQRMADPTDTRVAFGGMLSYLKVTSTGTPGNVGPVASNVAVAPQKTTGATGVTLSATLTDDVDNVVAYEYYVNDPTTLAGSGTVGTPAQSVSVSQPFTDVQLGTLPSGEHTFYIRGQDTLGAWGTLGSAVLNLDKAGPAITGLSLTPNPTNGGVDVVLSGTADDRNNGASNVVSAEYSVDGGATWLPMTLNSPNTPVSGLSATLLAADVFALGEGVHTVMVQAWDDFGNVSVVPGTIDLSVDQTGPSVPTVTLSPNVLDFNQQLPVTTVRLSATIADPLSGTLLDVQSTVAQAEGFLYTQGGPGTGFALYPSDGLFNEITEDAYYNIPVANFGTLPDGTYDILVVGKDKAGNWSATAGSASITVKAKVVDLVGPVVSAPIITFPNRNRMVVTATATDALSNVVEAIWFIGTDPDTAPQIYTMSAVDGAFDNLVEVVRGQTQINQWASGPYQISVMARDANWNWSLPATTSVTIP